MPSISSRRTPACARRCAGSYEKPVATRADPRSVVCPTAIGSPLRRAPPPRIAVNRSPWSGSSTTPTRSHRRARRRSKPRSRGAGRDSWWSRRSDRRATDPTRALDARSLLADDAVVGSRSQDPVDDQALGGAVDLGDHVGRRRLRAHLEPRIVESRAEQRRGVRGELPRERKQFLERLAHDPNASRTRRSGRFRCRPGRRWYARERTPPDPISFARGAPSADILPAEAVREAAARALDDDWQRALSYGTGIGHPGPLRVDRASSTASTPRR